MHYRMVIEMVIDWSHEDQVYVVRLPDFSGETPYTHGNTYREAAMAGEEVLELMLSGGCNSFQALAELEQ